MEHFTAMSSVSVGGVLPFGREVEVDFPARWELQQQTFASYYQKDRALASCSMPSTVFDAFVVALSAGCARDFGKYGLSFTIVFQA